MPVDILSSIKGAKPSSAVNKLFKVIIDAQASEHIQTNSNKNVISINELRDDIVLECPEIAKNIIRENFPIEKEGYLVVPKIIEN